MSKTSISLLVVAFAFWTGLLVSPGHAFVPQSPGHTRSPTNSGLAFVVVQKQQPSQQRHGRIGCPPLFMGWGPEPIWSTAKVSSNTVACPSESCVTITVDVDPEVGKEYTVPGQYVQLRLDPDTKPLFLAISSAPDAENSGTTLEFLIKKTDGNEWITSATPGTSMEISQVLGSGFNVQENFEGFKYDFPTQNVLLFAVGSGIAPIKAAMEAEGVVTGGGRTARLYYGVRTPDDLCFVPKFPEWEARGIQVVPVLSQPPESWQGRTGYVQNALEEDGVPIPRNSGALMCGMKGMTESVRDLLTKAGVFEGRILTNF